MTWLDGTALSDIKAGGTINFSYTTQSDSAVASGGHVSQNTGDQIFLGWPQQQQQYPCLQLA